LTFFKDYDIVLINRRFINQLAGRLKILLKRRLILTINQPDSKNLYTFDVDGLTVSGFISTPTPATIEFSPQPADKRFSFQAQSTDQDFVDDSGVINDFSISFVQNYLQKRMLYFKAASNTPVDVSSWW
jgi:hypothetical protein